MSDETGQTIYIEIPQVLSGERLDRALATILGCSRSLASDLIDTGLVFANDKLVTSRSRKITVGDKLRIINPDLLQTELATPVSDVQASTDESIALETAFEDEHIIIVNKPAGMVVHRGAGKEANTLVSAMLAYRPMIGNLVAECGCDPLRPGIVHRLDKDTSGLLVVAKTAPAYHALVAAMSDHKVKREYVALVSGLMEHDKGTIDAPIGRSLKSPMSMAVTLQGKQAITDYEVMTRYIHNQVTLVKVNLLTGRTHQIRVHLAAIGHKVMGDKTYGNKSNNLGLKRQFLHAHQLEFLHPVTQEKVICNSRLPDDLENVLSDLS